MSDKISRLLQIIKKDKPQEDHFFNKLATIENPFPYLMPLKEAGYFTPQNNPEPIKLHNQKDAFSIPTWNILGYLENVAKVNRKEHSQDISNTLTEIINDIICFRNEKGERVDNYRTDWIVGKIIFLLPINKIEDLHFEFIKSTFDSKWNTSLLSSELGETFLPILLESKNTYKVLKLLDIVLDFRTGTRSKYDEYSSIMDDYWLKVLLDLNKAKITELCAIEASEIAINKINEILESDVTQFNQIWIPAIEDHEQTDFTDRYEIQLVYFVRDMYRNAKPEKLLNIIGNLFNKEHPIYKRIAIHTINIHYNELKTLLWKIKINPLEIYEIKHELYELFRSRCTQFTTTQIIKVIKWIEEKEYFVSDGAKENSEVIIAYRKKEWLSSLLETQNLDVEKLFKKYDKINSTKLEHPGFDFWSESGWVVDESPISEAQLLSMKMEETVKYLNEYKEEVGRQKSNMEGLANTFEQCIQKNPQKYNAHLNLFHDVKPIFKKAIISGYNYAWKNKLKFELKNVFEFILSIIKQNNFWETSYQENDYNYREWIISQITNFIDEGTRKDEHAFDIEFNIYIEEILLLLVNKYEAKSNDISDLITTVLNSTKGKIFSSLLLFSLRYARILAKTENNRWLSSIKEEFTKRLDKTIEDSLDFSVVLGQYLRNLYYLDEEWVELNFEKIFPKEHDKYWEAAFVGYYYYATRVIKNIYNKFKTNGHFEKAINYNFKEKPIQERIVEHICVGYLENWEKLEDDTSLINRIIDSKQSTIISSIIKFFWKQAEPNEKLKTKVKPLWSKLYKFLKEEKNEKLLSELGEWLSLVDEIDNDIYEWMLESTKYFGNSHETYFIIQYLVKHVDNSPIYVGKIYLNILENGYYPYYKEEEIIKIIETVSKKEKSIGIRICNIYLKEGYSFVRDSLKKIKEYE